MLFNYTFFFIELSKLHVCVCLGVSRHFTAQVGYIKLKPEKNMYFILYSNKFNLKINLD